jgi:hypothetical protein
MSLDPELQGFDFSFLRCWRCLSNSFPTEEYEIIRLIEMRTKPGSLIISDQQMQAFRAGRLINPVLCDTSFNRIRSGYLKTPEAIRAAGGAEMVILWTHRLEELSGFSSWVEAHYCFLEQFGNRKVYCRQQTTATEK